MTQVFSLSGKVVVLTGGASGIGAATVELLAAHGAAVTFGYHPAHPHDPEPVLERARMSGGQVLALPVDVADADSVDNFVAVAADRHGPADIAVANAGVVDRRPSAATSTAQMRAVLDVDLLGVQHLFAAVVPAMRLRGWGRLLATSSTSGPVFGWAQRAAYCAAKAGIVGLVKTYAVEYGRDGITANAVAPGVVRSPQSLDPEQSLGPDGLRAVTGSIPVGRVGDPADVGAAFLFLASPMAGFVSGQTLVVDGGQSSVEAE